MNIWKLIALLKKAPREILKEIEELLDRHEHGKRHHAHHLVFSVTRCGLTVKGDNMQFGILVGQSQAIIGSPVLADGITPSKATLSQTVYTSSDPSIFTVGADPSTPNQAIFNGIANGTATLTETAVATEPDGATIETIQGVATITVTTAPPPPPPPAASLVFSLVGSPFPTPPPNPPGV